ncbi:MAG: hypothetical protein P8045_06065 [Candidatus Thiodiazotropha sp.]|jgi:hypothetical protein
MNIDPPDHPKDDEIPLLEDVVTPEELEIESEYAGFDDDSEEFTPATPEYDEVLLAMRDEIVAQLESELRPLVIRSVEKAIDEATERLTQILHDELAGPLGHRVRQLIDEHMEEEFGPREQPLDRMDDESSLP